MLAPTMPESAGRTTQQRTAAGVDHRALLVRHERAVGQRHRQDLTGTKGGFVSAWSVDHVANRLKVPERRVDRVVFGLTIEIVIEFGGEGDRARSHAKRHQTGAVSVRDDTNAAGDDVHRSRPRHLPSVMKDAIVDQADKWIGSAADNAV